MHLVDLTLVPKEATAVGETLQLLTAFDIAFVRTVMLVHVFTVETVS